MNENQHKLFEVSEKTVLFNPAKDKVIICHNSRGFWTIPGGHIEKDEQPIDAARREIREELGVDYAGKLRIFGSEQFKTPRNTEKINLHFVGELDEKTPIDVSQSGDGLDKYEWAPVSEILAGKYESWMISIIKEAMK